MKNLFVNFKYEIQLARLTKSFFILCFFMFSIFMLTYFNKLNEYKNNVKLYTHTYTELQNHGFNTDELLNKDFKFIEDKQENGYISQVLDNPLRYDFENMKMSRAAIEKTNLIPTLLKNTLLILLSASTVIYMIYITCFDISEKTIKTRLLMGNYLTINSSKLLAGIVLISISFFISLFASAIVSCIWTMIETQNHMVFKTIELIGLWDVFSIIVTSYVILLFYIIIGFALGILIRKISIASVVFLFFHFIVPSFGKYDYKNLILTLANHSFGIDKTVPLFIDGVHLSIAISLLFTYATLLVLLGFIRYKVDKRRGTFI